MFRLTPGAAGTSPLQPGSGVRHGATLPPGVENRDDTRVQEDASEGKQPVFLAPFRLNYRRFWLLLGRRAELEGGELQTQT